MFDNVKTGEMKNVIKCCQDFRSSAVAANYGLDAFMNHYCWLSLRDQEYCVFNHPFLHFLVVAFV